MRRDLTLADRDDIIKALQDGDRVKAIQIYITITEAGLTEAQYFIKALAKELDEPPKFRGAR